MDLATDFVVRQRQQIGPSTVEELTALGASRPALQEWRWLERASRHPGLGCGPLRIEARFFSLPSSLGRLQHCFKELLPFGSEGWRIP